MDEREVEKIVYEFIEEKVIDEDFLNMLKELSERTEKIDNASKILEEMRK